MEKAGSWPQITEVHVKTMISISRDSCIFPDIERAFLVAQLVKNLLAVQETLFQKYVRHTHNWLFF